MDHSKEFPDSDQPAVGEVTCIRREPLLNTEQAAAYLGLSQSTLRKLRSNGDGPVYILISRAVRYSIEDLDQYIDSHRRRSTSEYAGTHPGRAPPH